MMFPACEFANCEQVPASDFSEWEPAAERAEHFPTLVPQQGLRDFVSALKKKARFAAALGKTPQLEMIASELFSGQITVSIEEDPELEDKRYVVVHVEANGSVAEMAARRKQWYDLTHKLLGAACELVQLSITVV